VVDDTELNNFNEKLAFNLDCEVCPIIQSWSTNNCRDYLIVEHYGYKKLKDPLISRRLFYLDKDEERFFVIDKFTGKGFHRFNNRLHINKGVQVQIEESSLNKSIILSFQSSKLFIYLYPGNCHISLENSILSTSYGKKEKNQVLSFLYIEQLNKEYQIGYLFSDTALDSSIVNSLFDEIIHQTGI